MLGSDGHHYYYWDGCNRPYVAPMSFRIIDQRDNVIEAQDVIIDFEDGSIGSMNSNFAAMNDENVGSNGLNTTNDDGDDADNTALIVAVCIITLAVIGAAVICAYFGYKRYQ